MYRIKLTYFSKKKKITTNEYYQVCFITVAIFVAFYFDIQIIHKREPIKTNPKLMR